MIVYLSFVLPASYFIFRSPALNCTKYLELGIRLVCLSREPLFSYELKFWFSLSTENIPSAKFIFYIFLWRWIKICIPCRSKQALSLFPAFYKLSVNSQTRAIVPGVLPINYTLTWPYLTIHLILPPFFAGFV
jgi:hypothetical protein